MLNLGLVNARILIFNDVNFKTQEVRGTLLKLDDLQQNANLWFEDHDFWVTVNLHIKLIFRIGFQIMAHGNIHDGRTCPSFLVCVCVVVGVGLETLGWGWEEIEAHPGPGPPCSPLRCPPSPSRIASHPHRHGRVLGL